MKTYGTYLFFLGLCAIVFNSCSKDIDLIELPESSSELEHKIIDLYGSLEALKLPESDDYFDIPGDPKNVLTFEKVRLGKFLFHETGLALNPNQDIGKNTYSCASCHHAKAGFQSGMIQGIGEGGIGFGTAGETRTMSPEYSEDQIDTQPIRSPSILNTAYQKVMLWNGQFGAVGPNTGTEINWTADTPKETNTLGFEGLETQAIAGLSVHRLAIDAAFIENTGYKEMFDTAFANVQEQDRYSKLNAGLAIAAFERTVLANGAPFQQWLKGDRAAMNETEIKGANLFFGKGKCYTCHNGPGLNGMSFHALGMKDLSGSNVHGTVDEITQKGRGGFTNDPNDDYKFKTPTLYNLKDVAHLGHGGSFTTIKEVIVYKNKAIPENTIVPSDKLSPQFDPLGLNQEEIAQLTAFIENALYDNALTRYTPTNLPSGNCFPNADDASRSDLDCN
ncbi:MAG: cytochrome c peroxidase [Flavobacteriaceae bacterium]